MATYQKITSLLFKPQGVHNAAVDYSVMDVVTSPDKSRVYFAVQNVPAGIALTNEEYWQLQIDLSSSKSAMDEALASFGSYAKEIGTRVKGEAAKASGNPVTCLADAGSLLQPVTVLEPKQQGSGEPSPSNIRPISGYDKMDLNAAGKNLLPNLAKARSESGVTFAVNADGSITINGTATAQIIYSVYGDKLYLPAGEYIATNIRDGVNEKYYATFYSNPDSNERVDIYANDKPFTLAEGGCVSNFRIVVRSGAVFENLTFYPMIRRATIADATYAPYQGKLHTVQIGQTVYGGKLDWLTGKLVATHRKFAINNDADVSEFTFTVSASGMPYFNIYFNGDTVNNAKALSNAYTWISQSTASSSGKFKTYDDAVTIYDTAFTSQGQALQRLKDMNFEVVCQLATPIEIGPFTPHIISAADPEQTNTLYGDGRIDVEYVKPLHVSIEERVAAAVAAAMNTEGA